jgi:hypothetical protein
MHAGHEYIAWIHDKGLQRQHPRRGAMEAENKQQYEQQVAAPEQTEPEAPAQKRTHTRAPADTVSIVTDASTKRTRRK